MSTGSRAPQELPSLIWDFKSHPRPPHDIKRERKKEKKTWRTKRESLLERGAKHSWAIHYPLCKRGHGVYKSPPKFPLGQKKMCAWAPFLPHKSCIFCFIPLSFRWNVSKKILCVSHALYRLTYLKSIGRRGEKQSHTEAKRVKKGGEGSSGGKHCSCGILNTQSRHKKTNRKRVALDSSNDGDENRFCLICSLTRPFSREWFADSKQWSFSKGDNANARFLACKDSIENTWKALWRYTRERDLVYVTLIESWSVSFLILEFISLRGAGSLHLKVRLTSRTFQRESILCAERQMDQKRRGISCTWISTWISTVELLKEKFDALCLWCGLLNNSSFFSS